MKYYLNSNKISYRGKEYNSYAEIWREYGIKCATANYTRYIKKYGLEKAMEHYLNKNYIYNPISYRGKEYDNLKSLYNEFSNNINISYYAFVKKIRLHLDDIDGFMDVLLEEE